MCFTSGPTSDERGLTDGLRAKLLLISRSKRQKSDKLKLPAPKLSKAYAGVKSPQAVAEVVALTKKASPSRTAFNRLGSPAEIKVMQNGEAMTNSLSPKGVGSQRFVSNSDIVPKDVRSERLVGNSFPRDSKGVQPQRFASNSEIGPTDVRSARFISNSEIARKDVQSDRFPSDSVSHPKLDKKAFISAQFISKMNTKQMKGVMKGVGKELRRAATNVSEKLPTKKKNKEEKERRELLEAEPQKPQVRNADEIKKAYGHASTMTDETTQPFDQAAIMTRDKLHERGEKISAVQRRTAELDADAANFSSLAQELAKKMETKKWYEFS